MLFVYLENAYKGLSDGIAITKERWHGNFNKIPNNMRNVVEVICCKSGFSPPLHVSVSSHSSSFFLILDIEAENMEARFRRSA